MAGLRSSLGPPGSQPPPHPLLSKPAAGTDPAVDRAWGGALVLITLVMLLYAGAKLIARYTGVKRD